ncbi:MAG: response regulator [Candidatus Omnitrophica bacterium]|nr:response regulator [Candidatus Omnitrophota bacterium]
MAKKILIIDDEPDILRLAAIRLEASGYKLTEATDSEKALKLLEKEIPDLILLDLLLPKMQGGEFCKKLKSDTRFKNIPIVFFTANVTGIADIVKETGAQDYIIKPFEPEELLSTITKFIH